MGKGHPILGAIAGLFFGLFVAANLMFFKVTTLTSVVLFGCLAAGVVLGFVIGFLGPFRRGRASRAVATE